jgi:hypothetical protein
VKIRKNLIITICIVITSLIVTLFLFTSISQVGAQTGTYSVYLPLIISGQTRQPDPTPTQVPPTPTSTQVPATPTATQVPPTPTSTQVPPTPTSTQVPPTPTLTQEPTPLKETYIVTTGDCLGYKDRYIPPGDPVGFEYCDIDERRQMTLGLGDEVTYSSFMPFKYPSFCAIHTLDGEYIMSDVDVVGLGKAICTLPTSQPTPTLTPPKDTYIVTTGDCLGYEDRYIPPGDPVGFKYCDIDERRQMILVSGDEVTYSSFMPFKYPSFCAIHTLDDEYIMSDVDDVGLGKAICTLP